MTTELIERARAVLRQSRCAVLASDDRIDKCTFVLDGETGRPVVCLPPSVLRADEHVLFIPDESPNALQLLTIPEQLDPGDHCCDQWRVYFGRPTAATFIRFAIDCGKFEGHVLDGDDLMQRNDLLNDVAALCRHFNRQPGVIESLCLADGCQSPAPALLVGVDGHGFDVRTKFSVLRFEFGSRASDREDAAARIELMVKQGNDRQ